MGKKECFSSHWNNLTTMLSISLINLVVPLNILGMFYFLWHDYLSERGQVLRDYLLNFAFKAEASLELGR